MENNEIKLCYVLNLSPL